MNQGKRKLPFVSIVIPCRNEDQYIGSCLESIARQDYPKDRFEVIVVDGMSEDHTRDVIERVTQRFPCLRLKILDNPRRKTPAALNLAIRASKGQVIARVDAHCEIAPDYVTKSIEWMESTGAHNVGGPMIAVGKGYIGEAIALAHMCVFGLGGGKFHRPRAEGLADTVYNGTWPRFVFEQIGLFDENLERNQDIEFDSRLRRAGGRIYLTPEIKSRYYCRSSLSGLWQQNYANGFWNIYTIKRSPGSLSLRHVIPLLFVSAVLVAGAASPWLPPCRYIFLGIAPSYVLTSSFFAGLEAVKSGIRFFFVLPVVFAILHVSYGLGSLVGCLTLAFRHVLRAKQPNEKRGALRQAGIWNDCATRGTDQDWDTIQKEGSHHRSKHEMRNDCGS